MPGLGSYMHKMAVLRNGLDGTFSTVVARPAWCAARAPYHQADGTDIGAMQRRQSGYAGGSIDKMLCCTSGDMMALGCRRTGGGSVAWRTQHVDGSAAGNSPATTRDHGARVGIWGSRLPTGGVRLAVRVAQKAVIGQTCVQDWVERCCSAGPV
jgi:hypothetical protein